MTAKDHWQRLNTALLPGGPLWTARRALRGVAAFATAIDGLHVLARMCTGAADAIDSAAFLARLGCPEARKGGGIVLNPISFKTMSPEP